MDKKLLEQFEPCALNPYVGIADLAKKNKRLMTMPAPENVPKGQYCENCRYRSTILQPQVDMFGNNLEPTEKGYCTYYNEPIGDGIYTERGTKCFICSISRE